MSRIVWLQRGSDGGRQRERERDTERDWAKEGEMRVQYKCTQMVFVRRGVGTAGVSGDLGGQTG